MHLNKCKVTLKPDVAGIGKYPGRICDPMGKGRDTSAFCNINAWSRRSYPADNEKHESFGSISDRIYVRMHTGCSKNCLLLLIENKNDDNETVEL